MVIFTIELIASTQFFLFPSIYVDLLRDLQLLSEIDSDVLPSREFIETSSFSSMSDPLSYLFSLFLSLYLSRARYLTIARYIFHSAARINETISTRFKNSFISQSVETSWQSDDWMMILFQCETYTGHEDAGIIPLGDLHENYEGERERERS